LAGRLPFADQGCWSSTVAPKGGKTTLFVHAFFKQVGIAVEGDGLGHCLDQAPRRFA
jgi:hypothetical protein